MFLSPFFLSSFPSFLYPPPSSTFPAPLRLPTPSSGLLSVWHAPMPDYSNNFLYLISH